MSRSFIVLVVLIVSALAAVAVPSWRRAVSAPGVQGGIGEVRSFLSAEKSYAAVNGGYFDVPSCLAAPQGCLGGYPSNAPPFLDPRLGDLMPSAGYAFRFHAGPRPSPWDTARAKVSPTSLEFFAVVAVPIEHGRNRRAFCGDSSDRVCARKDGTMPDVKDGACPQDCETLR